MLTYYGVAKALAIAAHSQQKDKGGECYFKHVERVANRVHGSMWKTVAYLHDIIEDTPMKLHHLEQAGFTDPILTAVGLLTRSPARGTYAEYIEEIAISGNIIAIDVKLADLADNLSSDRAAPIPDSLRERYRLAQSRLEDALRQHLTTPR